MVMFMITPQTTWAELIAIAKRVDTAVAARTATAQTTAALTPAPTPSPPPETRRCFNCNKIGHISRDCRSKRRKQRRKSDSDDKEDEAPPKNERKDSSHYPFALLLGRIGNSEVEFFIDSGAQGAAISRALANKLGVTFSEPQSHLLANGSLCWDLGQTKPVKICFGRTVLEVIFSVLENPHTDAVLGIDQISKLHGWWKGRRQPPKESLRPPLGRAFF